jgi:hypothetical protein
LPLSINLFNLAAFVALFTCSTNIPYNIGNGRNIMYFYNIYNI